MSITTLKCNSNEDLYLPDGRNLFVLSEKDAIVQGVRQRTRLRKGENPFNVNEGVDYFGSIFSSPQDMDTARKSISDSILSCPDVISIESLTIDISSNQLNFSAEIITSYGKTDITSDDSLTT